MNRFRFKSRHLLSYAKFWHHCRSATFCYYEITSTKLVNCKCAEGASNANCSRRLLKAIRRVDGLVTSDEVEVRKLMLDREEAWRSRSCCEVNKEVDSSSKREDSKIRRGKTRSAIVVV
jgi:hypothetical protein